MTIKRQQRSNTQSINRAANHTKTWHQVSW